jgi:hypothetical protein
MTTVGALVPVSPCSVCLTRDDRRVRIDLSATGRPYRGGALVLLADDFRFELEGTDELAKEHSLNNWLSGIVSGALYAFRSLKVERQHLRLAVLDGKLSSADVDAVAAATTLAVAALSGKDAPSLDLAGWHVQSAGADGQTGTREAARA